MRPATTVVLGLLLVMILTAAVLQLFVFSRLDQSVDCAIATRTPAVSACDATGTSASTGITGAIVVVVVGGSVVGTVGGSVGGGAVVGGSVGAGAGGAVVGGATAAGATAGGGPLAPLATKRCVVYMRLWSAAHVTHTPIALNAGSTKFR